MTHKLTGTQPEPAKTRIYGSTPVEPLAAASNQPQVLPHIKVHGVKATPTVRVKLKGAKDGREMVIAAADFDPAKHNRID